VTIAPGGIKRFVRAAEGRDLCDNCGKRRPLKMIGSDTEVYFICRPCKQAFKEAAKAQQ
jgi:hypothetical protein